MKALAFRSGGGAKSMFMSGTLLGSGGGGGAGEGAGATGKGRREGNRFLRNYDDEDEVYGATNRLLSAETSTMSSTRPETAQRRRVKESAYDRTPVEIGAGIVDDEETEDDEDETSYDDDDDEDDDDDDDEDDEELNAADQYGRLARRVNASSGVRASPRASPVTTPRIAALNPSKRDLTGAGNNVNRRRTGATGSTFSGSANSGGSSNGQLFDPLSQRTNRFLASIQDASAGGGGSTTPTTSTGTGASGRASPMVSGGGANRHRAPNASSSTSYFENGTTSTGTSDSFGAIGSDGFPVAASTVSSRQKHQQTAGQQPSGAAGRRKQPIQKPSSQHDNSMPILGTTIDAAAQQQTQNHFHSHWEVNASAEVPPDSLSTASDVSSIGTGSAGPPVSNGRDAAAAAAMAAAAAASSAAAAAAEAKRQGAKKKNSSAGQNQRPTTPVTMESPPDRRPSNGSQPSSGGGSVEEGSGNNFPTWKDARREVREVSRRSKLDKIYELQADKQQLKSSVTDLEKKLRVKDRQLLEFEEQSRAHVDALEARLRDLTGGARNVLFPDGSGQSQQASGQAASSAAGTNAGMAAAAAGGAAAAAAAAAVQGGGEGNTAPGSGSGSGAPESANAVGGDSRDAMLALTDAAFKHRQVVFDYKVKLARAERLLQGTVRRCQELEEKRTSTNLERLKLEKEVETLRTEMEGQQRELGRALVSVDELEAERTEDKTKVIQLNKKVKESEAKITKMEKEVTARREKSRGLEEELRAKTEEMETIKAHLQEKAVMIVDLEKKLEENAAASAANEAAANATREAEEKLKQQTEELEAGFKQQLEKLEENLETLRKEKTSAERRLNEEVMTFEGRVADLEVKWETADGERKEAQNKVERLERELGEEAEKFTAFQSEAERIKQEEIDKWRTELLEKGDEVRKLQRDVEDAQERRKEITERLDRELGGKADAVRELQAQVDQLKDEQRKLEDDQEKALREKGQTIDELRADLRTAEASRSEGEYQKRKMEEEVKSKKAQIEAFEQEMLRKGEEAGRVRGELKEAELRISRMEKELEQSKEESAAAVAKVDKDLQTKADTLSTLQQEVERLTTEKKKITDRYEEEIRGYGRTIEKLEADVKTAHGERADAEANYEKLRAEEAERHASALGKARSEIDELRQGLETATELLQSKSEEFAEIESKLEVALSDLKSVRDRCEGLNLENRNLKQEASAAMAAAEAAKAEAASKAEEAAKSEAAAEAAATAREAAEVEAAAKAEEALRAEAAAQEAVAAREAAEASAEKAQEAIAAAEAAAAAKAAEAVAEAETAAAAKAAEAVAEAEAAAATRAKEAVEAAEAAAAAKAAEAVAAAEAAAAEAAAKEAAETSKTQSPEEVEKAKDEGLTNDIDADMESVGDCDPTDPIPRTISAVGHNDDDEMAKAAALKLMAAQTSDAIDRPPPLFQSRSMGGPSFFNFGSGEDTSERERERRISIADDVALTMRGITPPNDSDNISVGSMGRHSVGPGSVGWRQRMSSWRRNSATNNTMNRGPSQGAFSQPRSRAGSAASLSDAGDDGERDHHIMNLEKTNRANQDTIQKLRSEIVKLNSTLKDEAYSNKKKIETLEHENSAYAIKVQVLEQEFDKMNNSAREEEKQYIEDAETKIANLEAMVSRLEEESTQKATAIDSLRADMTKAREECDAELNSKELEIEQLRQENNAKSIQVSALKKEVHEAKVALSDAENESFVAEAAPRRSNFFDLSMSTLNLRPAGKSKNPDEDIRERDATIASLRQSCDMHEETVKNLKSELVNMRMMMKDEAYKSKLEMEKLANENMANSIKVKVLEKEFSEGASTGEDGASVRELDDAISMMHDDGTVVISEEGSTVKLDAAYFATLRAQIARGKKKIEQYDDKLTEQREESDKREEALRNEITALLEEKHQWEEELHVQIAAVEEECRAAIEELEERLECREATILSLERALEQLRAGRLNKKKKKKDKSSRVIVDPEAISPPATNPIGDDLSEDYGG